MIQAFSSLKTLVHAKRLSTESLVFYLHYRITFMVLLFCGVLVSTQYFAGKKISCLSRVVGEVNLDLLNNYCWAASTYSVKSGYLKEAGISEPHPGVGSTENESEYEYRNYYQYIHITIFIQAILFYIPHMVWKGLEGRFMVNLFDVTATFKEKSDKVKTKDSDVKTNDTDVKTKDSDVKTNDTDLKTKDSDVKTNTKPMNHVVVYIERRWGHQKMLALKYLFCEFLSACNVMMQSYLLDKLLHGKFLGLGLLVDVYYGSDITTDPIQLFPLVTICRFRKYGPSGYIDVIDSLCVLPNNVVNAKIFLCMWIWFLVLLILSFLSLVHLLFSMFVPFYRLVLVKMQSVFISGNIGNGHFTKLIKMGDFGDWFVLSAMKGNMESHAFSRLMKKLHGRISYSAKGTVYP